MAFSIKPNTVELEVAEPSGTRTQSYQEQVGTTTETRFVGCLDIGNSDIAFNPPYEKSFYSYTDFKYLYGVGDPSQGCQTSIYYYNWEPGIQKCFVMGMSQNDSITFSTGTWVNGPNNDYLPMAPTNDQAHESQVPGRTLYMVDVDKDLFTATGDVKNSTLIFDIVQCSPFAKTALLLKGTGTDNILDLLTKVPRLGTGVGSTNYTWYTSAYQHSGCWDSSGSGFTWEFDHRDNTRILSYEDDEAANKYHSIYGTKGELGMRSSDFKGDVDGYEVQVDVASMNNCRIQIHEGVPKNPNIISFNTPNDLIINSPGVYKFCLSALDKTGVWGEPTPGSNDGVVDGSAGATNSIPKSYFFASGGIRILTAINTAGNNPASCHINSITIVNMKPDLRSSVVPVYGGNYTYDVTDYDWKVLDVEESTKVPLSLTFAIGDLKDITKRTAGYSKTFNIPASQSNELVIKSMMGTNVERQYITWEKARIKCNGIVIFNGLLRIEQANTGKGGFYKCHIIQDTIDWSTKLADKQLCDVSLSQVTPKEKSRQEVIDSWSLNKPYHFDMLPPVGTGTRYAEDFFWGVANYGTWHRRHINASTAKHAHDVYDFHPVAYTKRIVEKIFLQSGYTLQSNFWNSVQASLLCHPFCSGETYYESDPNLLLGGGSIHLAEGKAPGGTCLGNYKSGGKIPADGHERVWWPVLNVTSDYSNNVTGIGSNNWGGAANKGYEIPFTGQYVISYTSSIKTRQSTWGNGARIWTYPTKNGNNIFGYEHMWWFSDYHTWTMGPLIFHANAGDVISFVVRGENYAKYYACWQDAKNFELLVYPDTSSTVPPQHVNLSQVLPCDVKQIDYLKGLTQMFNLQWSSDEDTKVVYCETYDEFFGSGKTLDWSDKLDNTSWNDQFIIEDLAKIVSFEYGVDSGDVGIEGLYKWREGNNKGIYQSHTQTHTDRFRKDELKLGTDVFKSTWRFNNYGTQANPGQHGASHPYAPSAYGWGDMTWTGQFGSVKNNPLMPVIWMENGGYINGVYPYRPPYTAFPKTDLRILNYYSLLNGRLVDETGNTDDPSVTNCVPWNFYEVSNKNLDYFPHMSWIDGYKKGVGVDPFCLSWGDYDDGFDNISLGLFSRYWNTAYQKMNGGSALRTCRMHLTPNDIATFDYRDLILININGVATYWTVNQIKDYKPNQEGLTQVELIEWKNAADFAHIHSDPSSLSRSGANDLPQNSKRIDTTTYNPMRGENGGIIALNNTENQAIGSGIALGHGVLANNNQTVVGRYNESSTTDIFQVGAGGSSANRATALSVSREGELEIQGGELIVEESNGLVHELVYEEEVMIDLTTSITLKKVYLKKEPKTAYDDGQGFASTNTEY